MLFALACASSYTSALWGEKIVKCKWGRHVRNNKHLDISAWSNMSILRRRLEINICVLPRMLIGKCWFRCLQRLMKTRWFDYREPKRVSVFKLNFIQILLWQESYQVGAFKFLLFRESLFNCLGKKRKNRAVFMILKLFIYYSRKREKGKKGNGKVLQFVFRSFQLYLVRP